MGGAIWLYFAGSAGEMLSAFKGSFGPSLKPSRGLLGTALGWCCVQQVTHQRHHHLPQLFLALSFVSWDARLIIHILGLSARHWTTRAQYFNLHMMVCKPWSTANFKDLPVLMLFHQNGALPQATLSRQGCALASFELASRVLCQRSAGDCAGWQRACSAAPDWAAAHD